MTKMLKPCRCQESASISWCQNLRYADLTSISESGKHLDIHDRLSCAKPNASHPLDLGYYGIFIRRPVLAMTHSFVIKCITNLVQQTGEYRQCIHAPDHSGSHHSSPHKKYVYEVHKRLSTTATFAHDRCMSTAKNNAISTSENRIYISTNAYLASSSPSRKISIHLRQNHITAQPHIPL
jgi:hypothetical protein